MDLNRSQNQCQPEDKVLSNGKGAGVAGPLRAHLHAARGGRQEGERASQALL